MRRLISSAAVSLAALVSASLLDARVAVAGIDTYLAIGDSLAFGETDFTRNPSNGADRGYVGPFAQYLSTFNGGAAPRVINLGLDGETSTTFLNGGAEGSGPEPGKPAYGLNTNYDGQPQNQNAVMLQTIADLHASGHGIGVITVQLGANDLFALALSPGFFDQAPDVRQAQVLQTLATYQANMAAILTELKVNAPEATIALLDYFDPFAPFADDPNSPLFPMAQASALTIPGLDQTIAGLSQAFHAKLIDIFAPFVGQELAYTHVADNGNVHPNATGYGVIVEQLKAVPEPSSVAMLALGAAVLVGYGRRRRGRAA